MASSADRVEVQPTELPATTTAQPRAASAKKDDTNPLVKGAATKPTDGVEYKVLKVRMPDGSLKWVKRPVAPADKNVAAKPTTAAPSTNNTTFHTKGSTLQGPKAAGSNTESINNSSSIPPPKLQAKPKEGVQAKVNSAESSSKVQVTSKPKEVVSEPTQLVESPKKLDENAATEVTSATTELSLNHEALQAQNDYYRQKRRHQFKTTLLRGLASSTAHTMLDFSAFESGDEAFGSDISSDDDHDDDHGDGHDDDDHHHHDDHDDGNSTVSHDGRDGHEHDGHNDSAGNHGGSGAHAQTVSVNVGAALGAVVAGAASNAPRPLPAAAGVGERGVNGEDKKDKVTYKITNKDVTAMEEKIEQNINSKPLQRHFVDVSFYIMASLSVILPLLFLLLAIVIGCANGKSVSSNWGKLREAIKIAISAWPIVFAAVVAQTFKTWATYRVERGIKLMELEQLVGSNSFASAVKQPFVLRRLNLLTLGMLFIWCLSPIGSQAMQYVYNLERGVVNENIDIKYLRTYGNNRLFSPSAASLDDLTQSALLELVSVAYMSSLMPPYTAEYGIVNGPHHGTSGQDMYNHPVVNQHGSYGIPLDLPTPSLLGYGLPNYPEYDANLDASYPASETITFNMTVSYFDFTTCIPWEAKKGSELYELSFSMSGTLGLGLNFSSTSDLASSTNTLYFASRTNFTSSNTASNTTTATEFDDWDFGYTECNFIQSFVNTPFICSTDLLTGAFTYGCSQDLLDALGPLPADEIDKSWYTNLTDFSSLWATSGNPYTGIIATTATERYAEQAVPMIGTAYTPDPSLFAAPAEPVAFYIQTVFNTWVSLGYCPECLPLDEDFSVYTALSSEVQDLFEPVTAKHSYTKDVVYVIDFRWWGVFLVCTILLLLLGIGSVLVESLLVAPDVLGYVSTVARNSRYINLPKTTLNGAMSGSERARTLGHTKVMMQDVKANAEVGKIALGMKHEKAERLKPGRLYR
ncbi:hypothetical protein BX600DRAFT_438248 [Xylariales sp. PMI_506]|nr:hypothetical protein BX600DRAFT_438248 [Xylariales sp. PMI_506]